MNPPGQDLSAVRQPGSARRRPGRRRSSSAVSQYVELVPTAGGGSAVACGRDLDSGGGPGSALAAVADAVAAGRERGRRARRGAPRGDGRRSASPPSSAAAAAADPETGARRAPCPAAREGAGGDRARDRRRHSASRSSPPPTTTAHIRSQSRSTIAIAIWWTILVGVALGIWPLRRVPRGAIAVGVLLAAFACWDLASSAWAPSAENAFYGVRPHRALPGRLHPGRRHVDPDPAPSLARRAHPRRARDRRGRTRQQALPRLVPGPGPAELLPTLEHAPELPARLLERPRDLRGARAFRSCSSGCSTAAGSAGSRPRRRFRRSARSIYLSSSRGAAAAALALRRPGFRRRCSLAAWPRCFALLRGRGRVRRSPSRCSGRSRALVDGPLGSAAARSDGHRAAVLLLVSLRGPRRGAWRPRSRSRPACRGRRDRSGWPAPRS